MCLQIKKTPRFPGRTMFGTKWSSASVLENQGAKPFCKASNGTKYKVYLVSFSLGHSVTINFHKFHTS